MTAVHLNFPAALKVQPTFHVSSWIWSRNLVRRLILLLPFELSMGGWRTRAVTFWMCVGGVEDGSFWWTGRDTVQRSDRGSPISTFWSRNRCVPPTGTIRTSPVVQLISTCGT